MTATLPMDVRERVARALTVWLCCEECEPDWPDQLEMADVALAAAGLVPAECRFCAAEPGGEPACIDGGEHHHLWDFAPTDNGAASKASESPTDGSPSGDGAA